MTHVVIHEELQGSLYFQAHNIRRVTKLQSFMKNKKEDLDKKQQVWEARFQKRSAEQARREHEDFLKFFQVNMSLVARHPVFGVSDQV